MLESLRKDSPPAVTPMSPPYWAKTHLTNGQAVALLTGESRDCSHPSPCGIHMLQRGGKKQSNLKTADSAELAAWPGIGPDRMWDLSCHRPYAGGEEVKRVPGISEETTEVLKRSGASLGS